MLHQLGLLLVLGALAGCAHSPETVVSFSVQSPGSWTVRDHTGRQLCALPCRVDLDEKESVVLARDSGPQFVVNQENLGPGLFDGAIRLREEPSSGAIALRAISDALVAAGGAMIETRRDHGVASGIVLTGLGAAGVLASSAIHGTKHEELWLTKMASSAR